MARFWVLNFDAELELGGREASAAARRMFARLQRIQLPFMCSKDRVFGREAYAEPLAGAAWCPTPNALLLLKEVGAPLPDGPSAAVLRHVNGRAFCASLGQTLTDAVYASTAAEVCAAIKTGGAFLLKRALAASGQGIRRVTALLSMADRHWIEAQLRHDGGLQVEPEVDLICEFATHGFIANDGILTLRAPVVQHISRRKTWRRAQPLFNELAPRAQRALFAEARRSARALYAAGYFGPFGMDAFTYRRDGFEGLQPRSEINARYTMAWGLTSEVYCEPLT